MKITLTLQEAAKLCHEQLSNTYSNNEIQVNIEVSAIQFPYLDPSKLILGITFRDKIQDIKFVRETGRTLGFQLGLAECKAFIENIYMLHHGTTHAELVNIISK